MSASGGKDQLKLVMDAARTLPPEKRDLYLRRVGAMPLLRRFLCASTIRRKKRFSLSANNSYPSAKFRVASMNMSNAQKSARSGGVEA
jgi:hypothetical protein